MVKDYHDVLKQSMQSLQGEVETLRQDMANLSLQTHILATQLYSHDTLEHHVIYTNGFKHEHPADLIQLKNGELLLMTREASEHYSNDGDVVMVRSKDGGLTWEGRQVVAGLKDIDEREGCGIQLKDGTIIVGFFYNNLYNPDGTYGTYYNWEKQHTESVQRDTTGPVLGAYTMTSTDNGRTWSKPNFIDTRGMPFKNLEGPTDAPIEMPDGSIIMGVIGYSPHGNTGNRAAVMVRSTDKGKSWKYLSTMAGDPDGTLGGFLEPGIVRTKTGRIVAALRNHGSDQAIYTTYSDDNGKTWVPVQKTAMTGHPVDLIQLKDGRVMASYGIRTGPHAKPGGIRVCFSSDNGATWDIKTEKQLRNDFINWDTGYPESLQLPNGRILTVYYYNLFGKYYIGGTFWKP
jgi:Neuraminidase (sialidase)